MTKLQELSSALLEAGWLITLVIAVLFLNPFSLQVFDPAKAFLFRSLALLLFAILVIRELEAGEHIGGTLAGVFRAVPRTPFAGLILAFVLIHVISTLLSVSPRVSFWGSYKRTQGTYTLFGYAVLFLVVLRGLRRRDQLERLVTVLLAISFPVAAYGVLQHFEVTLLEFSGPGIVVPQRVISTIGNAIFLAAYLAMVVPLTLWRLIRSSQDWLAVRSPGSASAVAIYVVLLALQLLCMLYTQSRGPLLGLAVALFTMFFVAALLYGRRGWAWGVLAAGTFTFLFLVALNVPALPLDSLRKLAYLDRFSQLSMELARGSVLRRTLAWESTLNAVAASPRRALLGYGPDTMRLVFDRFMVAELVPLLGEGFFDRAHNGLFDALFETGLLGAAAYLLLFGLIFYRACCWLGLVVAPRDRWLLAGLMLAGAGLGLLAPAAVRGDFVFVGVGVPAGMLGGLFLYLVTRLLRGSALEPPADLPDGILLVALLAAVIGHWVEGFTGIGTVSTHVHFWLYLALMAFLGPHQVVATAKAAVEQQIAGHSNAMQRGVRASRRKGSDGGGVSSELGSLVAMSLVVAVMLACLVFAFLHGFNRPGARRPAVGLIGVTWLFSGLLILLERRRTIPRLQGPGREMAIYTLVSLVWVLPFGWYYAARVRTAGAFDESLIVFTVWLFLTVGVAAIVWRWGRLTSPHPKLARGLRVALYAVGTALALIFAWTSNLNPMRADVYAKIGEMAIDAGRWQLRLDSLQRAVELDPDQAEYYLSLGDAYLEQARLASDCATKDAWLEWARQALEYGWALAPDDSDYPRKLGVVYRTWARPPPDCAGQVARLEESLRYYLAAAELSPQSPRIRMELAEGYFALGRLDDALGEYQRVVALNFRERLAEAYAGMGDVYVAQGKFSAAAEAYRRAMHVVRRSQDVLEVRSSMVDNNPDRIDLRERLALLYAGMGRRDEALKELQIALELADGKEREQIEQLIRDLQER